MYLDIKNSSSKVLNALLWGPTAISTWFYCSRPSLYMPKLACTWKTLHSHWFNNWYLFFCCFRTWKGSAKICEGQLCCIQYSWDWFWNLKTTTRCLKTCRINWTVCSYYLMKCLDFQSFHTKIACIRWLSSIDATQRRSYNTKTKEYSD